MEQRKQRRGWNGHFLGFWARLNCENMSVIPAWIVRSNLNDPRRIPYVLVWKDDRHDGEIKEAVRLARFVEPSNSRVTDNYVELKRTEGAPQFSVSFGECCPGTAGGPCCWSAPTTTRRAVTSTVGNDIAFRDGRTESGASVGDAARVLNCATLPKAAICGEAGVVRWGPYFALSETCHDQSRGFLTCSLPEAAAEVGVCELSSVSWYEKR